MAVIGERRSDRCFKAARASQLSLGINYEQQGKINEALATYLGIIARYPESEEREVAEERLLRLTRAFFEGSARFTLPYWSMSIWMAYSDIEDRG